MERNRVACQRLLFHFPAQNLMMTFIHHRVSPLPMKFMRPNSALCCYLQWDFLLAPRCCHRAFAPATSPPSTPLPDPCGTSSLCTNVSFTARTSQTSGTPSLSTFLALIFFSLFSISFLQINSTGIHFLIAGSVLEEELSVEGVHD